VRVLLTLSAALVVTGCTERQVHVTGVSGSIVWQVTDFRIVARSVQGTPRDEYRKFKSIFAPFPPPPAPAGGHAVLPARAAPPARCGRPAGAARSKA
jgi:hypothetical protein